MAGRHSKSEEVEAERTLDARVDILIERGLELYRSGDTEAAVAEWEHALTLRSGDPRARRYIDFVRSSSGDTVQIAADTTPADVVTLVEAERRSGVAAADAAYDDAAYDDLELDLGAAGGSDIELIRSGLTEAERARLSARAGQSRRVPMPPADPIYEDERPGPDLRMGSVPIASDFSEQAPTQTDAMMKLERADDDPHGFEDSDADTQTDELSRDTLGFVRAGQRRARSTLRGREPAPLPGQPPSSDRADSARISTPALGTPISPPITVPGIVSRRTRQQTAPRLSPRTGLPERPPAPEPPRRRTRGLRPTSEWEDAPVGDLDGAFDFGDDDADARDSLGLGDGEQQGGAPSPGRSGEPDVEDLGRNIDLSAPGLLPASLGAEPMSPGHAPEMLPAALDIELDPPGESPDIQHLGYRLTPDIQELPAIEPGDSLGPEGDAGGADDAFADSLALPVAQPEPADLDDTVFTGAAPPVDIDRLTDMDDIADALHQELDALDTPDASASARLRRRLTALLERAWTASEAGRDAVAVTALDLVFGEDPDSAVTQKLIQSHRDAILAVYNRYLGDAGAVPRLAISLTALRAGHIDNRAAFLLSRVDGVLSVDEILDISGMSRLEAYRYLCSMRLRGIVAIE